MDYLAVPTLEYFLASVESHSVPRHMRVHGESRTRQVDHEPTLRTLGTTVAVTGTCVCRWVATVALTERPVLRYESHSLHIYTNFLEESDTRGTVVDTIDTRHLPVSIIRTRPPLAESFAVHFGEVLLRVGTQCDVFFRIVPVHAFTEDSE